MLDELLLKEITKFVNQSKMAGVKCPAFRAKEQERDTMSADRKIRAK